MGGLKILWCVTDKVDKIDIGMKVKEKFKEGVYLVTEGYGTDEEVHECMHLVYEDELEIEDVVFMMKPEVVTIGGELKVVAANVAGDKRVKKVLDKWDREGEFSLDDQNQFLEEVVEALTDIALERSEDEDFCDWMCEFVSNKAAALRNMGDDKDKPNLGFAFSCDGSEEDIMGEDRRCWVYRVSEEFEG